MCDSHTIFHHKTLSGTVVTCSRLDYSAGDPGSIPAGAEFPTGIQFWVITFPAVLAQTGSCLGR